MAPSPDAPIDARLIYSDGECVPLELRYVGVNNEGLHEWQPVGRVRYAEHVRLVVGFLPENTAVVILAGSIDGLERLSIRVDPSVPEFYCVHCGMRSFNAHDVEFSYCGNCHHFCEDVSTR